MAVAVDSKIIDSKTSGCCNTENDQICGPFASLSSFILRERAAFGGLGPCPMFRRWARDDAFSFANLRHPNEPFSMNQNVCFGTLGKLFDGGWPIGTQTFREIQ